MSLSTRNKILIALVLVLLLAGGGAYYWLVNTGGRLAKLKKQTPPSIAAPVLLEVKVLSDKALELRWHNPTLEAENVVIFRQQAPAPFQAIDTVSAVDTTYIDSTVVYGMTYTYALVNLVGNQQSSISNQLSGSTQKPPEPSQFTAVLKPAGIVKLTWKDNCSFEDGYELQRREGETYHTIAKLPPNSTVFRDTLKAVSEKLKYRLRCYTLSHASPFVVAHVLCGAPRSFELVSPDDQTIVLTWRNECDLARGFKIERRSGSSGNYKLIARLKAGVNRYVDKGLKHGVNYKYRIYTLSPDGFSAPAYVSGTTYFPAPYDLKGKVFNGTRIELQWKEDCPFEDGFLVQRRSGKGRFTTIKRLPPNTHKFWDRAVKFGLTYEYRVVAYTAANRSQPSNRVTVKSVLPAPSNLTVKALDDSRISLSWKDNCTFEKGYVVERKAGKGKFEIVGRVAANTTHFVDSGLKFGETYIYRVRTTTANSLSDPSREVKAETIFPAPAALTAKALDDSRVVLEWKDRTSFESGFIIQRKAAGGRFKTIGKVKANITKVVDKKLKYRQLYLYRVAAYTRRNRSPFSNTVSVQTFLPAPTSLKLKQVGDKAVKLTWHDKCKFEAGYRVERKVEGGRYKVIARLKPNSQSFTDKKLDPTLVYYWRVAAYTRLNVSDYAGPVKKRLVPLDFVLIPGKRVGSSRPYVFSMSKYEVTNRQFATFLKEALKRKKIRFKKKKLEFRYPGDKRWKKGWYQVIDLADPDVHIHYLNGLFRVDPDYAQHPVTEITWFGAFAFAQFYHCRLPTEEEWEAVAGGEQGLNYPWGDEIDSSRANYWNSKDPWDNGTTPVGLYDGKVHRGFATKNGASSDGVYDLAGNVWEWTSSFWSDDSRMRVLRGGSWHDGPEELTIESRRPEDPRHASRYVGFRVIHDLPKPSKRKKK